MEATAEALTREEVLRRRRRRAKRLVDVYRRLYWTLGEELRARHRQYVWELGRSPLEAEQPPPPPPTSAAPGPGGDLVVVRPVSATVPRRKKCGFAGCKVRTMAMARFCHSHILSDPNQVLYKGCAYISKRQVADNPSSSPRFSDKAFWILGNSLSGSNNNLGLRDARLRLVLGYIGAGEIWHCLRLR
ncbi:hypothetical protein OsI_19380 [Oryza sativa Indica Group]|uniref:KANL2-like probable zinc-finger domain-containing protein n=1 Tax=Oryza sativa subsp. indica TaxID=39946 RepID=B8AWB9_ORYSI|nr:hypothetical protein OsI_19380 [Oryza sativa Indica Group]